jgi:hypothetical protein
LSGLYVAQSSPGSKCQSVNPDTVGTLPLSYAGLPLKNGEFVLSRTIRSRQLPKRQLSCR